jgi:hypothetical protein
MRNLFVLKSDIIVEASEDEIRVASGYASWADKGKIIDGRRLTIMTSKTKYKINEEVRVVHVVEFTEPGHNVYIMGPKEVYGEYVDGRLSGKDVLSDRDPFVPEGDYDGRVLNSPAADYNYYITSYTFNTRGIHSIYWKLGKWKSNVLKIMIE